jgi:hypothetical protein
VFNGQLSALPLPSATRPPQRPSDRLSLRMIGGV